MASIFTPISKAEIERRKKVRVNVILNEILSRQDCIKNSDGTYSVLGALDIGGVSFSELPIKFKYIHRLIRMPRGY